MVAWDTQLLPSLQSPHTLWWPIVSPSSPVLPCRMSFVVLAPYHQQETRRCPPGMALATGCPAGREPWVQCP